MNPNPLVFLLKFLLNIELYTKYRDFIDLKEATKEIKQIFTSLDTLIAKYNRTISIDEFYTYTLSMSEHPTEVSPILDTIYKADLHDDVVLELLEDYKARSTAHKIALLAIDVNEGRKSMTDLTDAFTKLNTTKSVTTQYEFITDDLEALYNEQIKRHGLRWRLQTLNRMLGSLRKGDFGFIFARPETGKTTFLASEISFFAEQLQETDGPIICFNNEEDGKKVKIRYYQASLGLTLPVLLSNREKANADFTAKTNSKIKIYDKAIISRHEVEGICRDLKPSCIIFDQLDKITGFDGDREDLRLGSIYTWARELAKMYGPVIGVTQADGTAEGKKWLTMDNVANAKTAKQAEADWILGIGATHAEGFEYVRHLHLSKNKLTGDEDTDPEQRHGKQDVLIEPTIARYKDYG